MPNWKHKLRIKHFFMDYDGMPISEETTEMAKNIIASIKNLQNKIDDTSDLWHDLDNIIEEFEMIGPEDNDEDAQEYFNYTLSKLYDEADFQHRIWVE